MSFLRTHPYLFAVYVAITAVAIGLLVDGISASDGDTGEPLHTHGKHLLELIVTSTESDSAAVSFVTPGSDPIDISQIHDARLPWSKKFHQVRPLQIGFNLKALQSGSGRLTCIIKLDGEVIEQDTVAGQGAVATCSP